MWILEVTIQKPSIATPFQHPLLTSMAMYSDTYQITEGKGMDISPPPPTVDYLKYKILFSKIANYHILTEMGHIPDKQKLHK